MSKDNVATLLGALKPTLNNGVFVFSTLPVGTDLSALSAVATFHEQEGTSVITSEAEARRANLPVLFRSAWITLGVNSDLNAVGLTAAVATALSNAGIPCNIVAAARHDHVFVPIELADQAMERLHALQAEAQSRES
jgi:hypothetical protein